MVRAKFTVNRIERSQEWNTKKELQTIVMSPVTGHGEDGKSDENKQFWAYTPSGEIKLGTVNAEAAAMFELGKSYYVDFTPAE
jgi:hypothetical protein